MNTNPVAFFKCLADETRLKILLLVASEGELCVCELTEALTFSQPKISRHLAQLRDCELLDHRREGQWVYYRLHDNLPLWAQEVIQTTLANNGDYLKADSRRLAGMGERPQRKQQCC